MSAPTVVAVAPDSPAARAGILPGDEIARIDGVVPRDLIEWRVFTDEADVQLDVVRHGTLLDLEVPKRAGEPLGVEVQSAVFDRVRTCDNHCEFCFIYQLPKGMRRSLYLKDDDYRLSFLYGNFTTLTRFTEADLERVVTEGLSPLHVSIHAIDHDVRNRMLKNPRGAMSLRWLRALLDHGIEVRGQIVVCPGVNDGDVLDHTLAGVLDRFPELESVAVVPLGLSRFNTEPAMRLHTAAEANRVVDLVAEWQDRFLAVLGRRMVHAADEYYLMTGRPFPPAEAYEGFPMHEDGIGMAQTFSAEFLGETDAATGVRRGFFAAVDLPQNPAPYTNGTRSRRAATGEPDTNGVRPPAAATGTSRSTGKGLTPVSAAATDTNGVRPPAAATGTSRSTGKGLTPVPTAPDTNGVRPPAAATGTSCSTGKGLTPVPTAPDTSGVRPPRAATGTSCSTGKGLTPVPDTIGVRPPRAATGTSCSTGGGLTPVPSSAGGGLTPVSLGRAQVGVLTGTFGAQVLAPLLAPFDHVRVIPVVNEFFGGNTGVTGLMTGADLTRVLAEQPAGHRYLLPDVCLSDDGRFLDGLTVADLPRPVEVVSTDGIALRKALA